MTGRDHHSLDHVGIAVASLDAGAALLQMIGLNADGPDESIAAVGTVVRCFSAGEILIELVAPAAEDSPLCTFLSERGPGLHHIALRVDDLDAEISALTAAGAAFFIAEPFAGRGGSRVAFLAPDPASGTLIELVQHAGEPCRA